MNRLKEISKYLKGYETACDIGCDHGLVLKYAFDNNYIKKGIAIDNKIGPLENAKKNLKNYDCLFYLNDGVKNLNLKYDIGIISGMGSETIINILTNSPKTDYILVTHSDIELLRKYLFENSFLIVEENIIYDKFYYVVIKVKYIENFKANYDTKDMFFGKILPSKINNNKIVKDYFLNLLTRYEYIFEMSKNTLYKDLIIILRGLLK